MKRFGTLEGVFTPCLLSILGVIMYLRLGWVVGKVGLLLTLGIIVLSNIITLATALSMSSIVTNIRIGTGGAYSIIAKSLGIEAGGAIGIPLYLSQAISVAFYIVGFAECWHSVFPQHSLLQVSLVLWGILFVVSYYSAKFAFRLQYAIMIIIALSLVSIFLGGQTAQTVPLGWGQVQVNDFWKVFAIFFPAVTGILAGAAMSGELVDPQRSIPRGTLAAIGVSFVIYVSLAGWFAHNASAQDLVANTSILIDLGRWKPLVVAGIMGATLSSALSMFVGSPRTFLALGKHSIVPFSGAVVRVNKRGEPTTAILFTALLVLVTLLLGTLDNVANLLTMFFLITYGMINLSVFFEQSIGIASFRPTFRISRFIPFLGSVGCIVVMLLINAKFSLFAFVSIVIIYILLLRREVKIHSSDIRSGLLIFMAEQFAKAAAKLPYHPKIWKPNLIVPIEDMPSFARLIPFVKSIIAPTGRLFLFTVLSGHEARVEGQEDGPGVDFKDQTKQELINISHPLREADLFVEASVVESPDFTTGSITTLQAMRDMFFPPNTLFCVLSDPFPGRLDVVRLVAKASHEGLGIIILKYHLQKGFGKEQTINLWIRQQSPNIDLSILTALQLKNNWDGQLRLVQAVQEASEVLEAQNYLMRIQKIMRIPLDIEIKVVVGDFRECLTAAPAADINIFGMPEKPDIKLTQEVFDLVQSSVLFLRDSEHESAVA